MWGLESDGPTEFDSENEPSPSLALATMRTSPKAGLSRLFSQRMKLHALIFQRKTGRERNVGKGVRRRQESEMTHFEPSLCLSPFFSAKMQRESVRPSARGGGVEWASHRQERFFANYPNVRNRKEKEEEICSAFNAVALCRVQKAQRPSMPHSIVQRVQKEDFCMKGKSRGRILIRLQHWEGVSASGGVDCPKIRLSWEAPQQTSSPCDL